VTLKYRSSSSFPVQKSCRWTGFPVGGRNAAMNDWNAGVFVASKSGLRQQKAGNKKRAEPNSLR
jgi:hypothetical protein